MSYRVSDHSPTEICEQPREAADELISRTIGIVVAAGSGSRLGASVPKAFVPVRGKPMVDRAVGAIRDAACVASIIVVVPPKNRGDSGQDHSAALAERLARDGPLCTVEGGETRQESVRRALMWCRSALPGAQFVAIHDAARCLMPAGVIRRVVEAAWDYGAATAALPAVDTLRRIEDAVHHGFPGEQNENPSAGVLGAEVDRTYLWQIQTPQAFELELLWRGHHRGDDGGQFGLSPDSTIATDDTALVSPFHPVHVVRGSRFGFKVTSPEDLAFAEIVADQIP